MNCFLHVRRTVFFFFQIPRDIYLRQCLIRYTEYVNARLCVVQVVNGVYAFWPLSNVSTQGYILGYTGVAGGALFLAGSILGLFEVNLIL